MLPRLVGKVNFQFPAKVFHLIWRRSNFAIVPPSWRGSANPLSILHIPEHIGEFQTSVRARMVPADVGDPIVGFCVTHVAQNPRHATYG